MKLTNAEGWVVVYNRRDETFVIETVPIFRREDAEDEMRDIVESGFSPPQRLRLVRVRVEVIEEEANG